MFAVPESRSRFALTLPPSPDLPPRHAPLIPASVAARSSKIRRHGSPASKPLRNRGVPVRSLSACKHVDLRISRPNASIGDPESVAHYQLLLSTQSPPGKVQRVSMIFPCAGSPLDPCSAAREGSSTPCNSPDKVFVPFRLEDAAHAATWASLVLARKLVWVQ
jgi:hypothetical protein